MSTPLLSFIIPVYNKENYLDNCIESVILPDWDQRRKIELILIDDCSGDGSREICRKWEALYPNIICLYLKENVGAGMARNEGLKKAQGKYLFFLDADDTIQTEKLPYVLELLEKQAPYPVVCFAKQLRSLGDFNRSSFTYTRKTEELLEKTPDILLTSLWNYIFSLDFLRKTSIIFGNERVCEDYSVVSKMLLAAGECFFINDMIYNYRKYVPEGTALASNYRERYYGGQTYLQLLAEYENILESNTKRKAVRQAREAIRFLMFCTPVPLEHSEETERVFQRQKKLVDFIEVRCREKERKIYLCPACDIALEISEIMRIHGVDIEGFADNRLENNENVIKIVERGQLVKSVAQLDKKEAFVCICHRNYLADILSRQLMSMGMEKGIDFYCIQEYV